MYHPIQNLFHSNLLKLENSLFFMASLIQQAHLLHCKKNTWLHEKNESITLVGLCIREKKIIMKWWKWNLCTDLVKRSTSTPSLNEPSHKTTEISKSQTETKIRKPQAKIRKPQLYPNKITKSQAKTKTNRNAKPKISFL